MLEGDSVGAEPIEGTTLRAWVTRGGLPSVQDAVDAVLLACIGVTEALCGGAWGDIDPDHLRWAVRPDGSAAIEIDATEHPGRPRSILYKAPEQLERAPTVRGEPSGAPLPADGARRVRRPRPAGGRRAGPS